MQKEKTNFVVINANGFWGKGKTLKDALKNANVHFNTKFQLSVVEGDFEINDFGQICGASEIYFDTEFFSISDFLDKDEIKEIAFETLFDLAENNSKRQLFSDLVQFENQLNGV